MELGTEKRKKEEGTKRELRRQLREKGTKLKYIPKGGHRRWLQERKKKKGRKKKRKKKGGKEENEKEKKEGKKAEEKSGKKRKLFTSRTLQKEGHVTS